MAQKEKNPAFVLRKVEDVSIEERPLPKLESPYDVKVHVKATGYRTCHATTLIVLVSADPTYTITRMERLAIL